jgi:hypothetical protein
MAKKGKYAGVVDRLPKYTAEDDSYQDKVNKKKAEIADEVPMIASSLAQAYVISRRGKKILEEQIKGINLEIEALRQLIVDRFEVEGTSSVSLDTGESIRVQLEPHARVVDKEANRQWAIAQGLEKQLALPWQTLNSLTKDLMLRGEPEPDGVAAFVQGKVFVTGLEDE